MQVYTTDKVNDSFMVVPLISVMSFFRRSRPGVAQAFRNNRQLQQFVLTGVTPTGRVLGTGSYGSVEEVKLSFYVFIVD